MVAPCILIPPPGNQAYVVLNQIQYITTRSVSSSTVSHFTVSFHFSGDRTVEWAFTTELERDDALEEVLGVFTEIEI